MKGIPVSPRVVLMVVLSVLVLFTRFSASAGEEGGRESVQSNQEVALDAASISEGSACAQVISTFQEHQRETSRELRQIKRELARLRASREKPSLRDVLAGIGYILGLFGTAAFVLSRKRPNGGS